MPDEEFTVGLACQELRNIIPFRWEIDFKVRVVFQLFMEQEVVSLILITSW